MKKFSFPLQKVLEYNTHIQKKEKDSLAFMRAEYFELENQMVLLIQKHELNKQKYLNGSVQGINAFTASSMLLYIKEIEKQIDHLRKIMTEKQNQIDLQTEKLIRVTQDKMTVEKLKENKLEKYKTVERKSEENSIEEFISYINSAAS